MNIQARAPSYLLSDREGLKRTPVAISSLQPSEVCRKVDREQAGIVWRLPPPSMPAVPFFEPAQLAYPAGRHANFSVEIARSSGTLT